MSKARKKLEDIEARLAAIGESERALSTEYGAARSRVEELQLELEEAFEQGAIGLDGSPSDEQVRKLHAVLAKAKTEADPELFERKRAGLQRARQKLEAERVRVATENFDDLAAELVEDAQNVRSEFDEALTVIGAVAQRWQSLASAWLTLERAADLGRDYATRLDIPKFPLDVTGDLDAMPIPPSLADGDPTITSAT
jgi:DNA repair exonuclease SbcCD ATPase subunit